MASEARSVAVSEASSDPKLAIGVRLAAIKYISVVTFIERIIQINKKLNCLRISKSV